MSPLYVMPRDIPFEKLTFDGQTLLYDGSAYCLTYPIPRTGFRVGLGGKLEYTQGNSVRTSKWEDWDIGYECFSDLTHGVSTKEWGLAWCEGKGVWITADTPYVREIIPSMPCKVLLANGEIGLYAGSASSLHVSFIEEEIGHSYLERPGDWSKIPEAVIRHINPSDPYPIVTSTRTMWSNDAPVLEILDVAPPVVRRGNYLVGDLTIDALRQGFVWYRDFLTGSAPYRRYGG